MRQLIGSPAQIGEILRGRRRARGLAQADIARALGISQERVSRLEADPSQLTLERLITMLKLLGLVLVLEDATETKASDSEW
jgi:HTH-type transcriptional regulator/antitoxin HipB